MKFMIWIIILCGLMIVLGWCSNEIYRDLTNKRVLDGIRIGNVTEEKAEQMAYKGDILGDWVCVNVKGMPYERGVKVCQHEMGHEVFAEILEKSPEKINKVMEVIQNETE
jgi:hypothetical protein